MAEGEEWRVSKQWDATKPADLPARTMSVMFTAGGSIANQSKGTWAPDRAWPPAGQFPDWAGRRRASMHMPRWASRLTLIVTATTIEHLQGISEADAKAEGIEYREDCFGTWNPDGTMRCGGADNAREAFRCLWINLHGTGAWDANPEVVALRFTVIKANIDALEARAA
jgi:hypothetical protein